MISALISGFMLGLALIGPIGPQNLYVIRAGLALSPVRVLVVVLAATLCDALLITLGTAGAGAVVTEIPGMLGFLLAAGAAFLVYLGVKSLRAGPPEMGLPSEDGRGGATKLLTRQTVGVSLLNPHAILDTTVVIGATAAALGAGARVPFAVGAVGASLLWFLLIGLGANVFKSRMTPVVAQWIEVISGLVLLLFAAKLGVDLLGELGLWSG